MNHEGTNVFYLLPSILVHVCGEELNLSRRESRGRRCINRPLHADNTVARMVKKIKNKNKTRSGRKTSSFKNQNVRLNTTVFIFLMGVLGTEIKTQVWYCGFSFVVMHMVFRVIAIVQYALIAPDYGAMAEPGLYLLQTASEMTLIRLAC